MERKRRNGVFDTDTSTVYWMISKAINNTHIILKNAYLAKFVPWFYLSVRCFSFFIFRFFFIFMFNILSRTLIFLCLWHIFYFLRIEALQAFNLPRSIIKFSLSPLFYFHNAKLFILRALLKIIFDECGSLLKNYYYRIFSIKHRVSQVDL